MYIHLFLSLLHTCTRRARAIELVIKFAVSMAAANLMRIIYGARTQNVYTRIKSINVCGVRNN